MVKVLFTFWGLLRLKWSSLLLIKSSPSWLLCPHCADLPVSVLFISVFTCVCACGCIGFCAVVGLGGDFFPHTCWQSCTCLWWPCWEPLLKGVAELQSLLNAILALVLVYGTTCYLWRNLPLCSCHAEVWQEWWSNCKYWVSCSGTQPPGEDSVAPGI